jgi:hypothetical protein
MDADCKSASAVVSILHHILTSGGLDLCRHFRPYTEERESPPNFPSYQLFVINDHLSNFDAKQN